MSKHRLPVAMLRRRSTLALVAAALLATPALSACGSDSGSGGTSPGATTKVTFALDYTVDGLHAPMYVAKDKGYYSSAGLDVTLQPGQGSSDAIHKVQTGVAQIGLASATNVLLSAATNTPPVKVVAILVPNTPAAIESLKGSNITEPKDIIGKTLGQSPAASTGLVGALFQKVGIPLSQIKIVAMQPSSQAANLLAGKVDTVASYAQVFADKTDKVNFIYLNKYGINPYSSAIIVSPDFLKSHPDQVKAFVQATMKGLADSVANPDEAGATVGKAAGTNSAYFQSEVKVLNQFWSSSDISQAGYGTMTADAWKATQDFNVQFGGQKRTLSDAELTDLWTNDYLGTLQH